MATANEIELKFNVTDREEVKAALERLGFVSHGEVFETNIVLDTPDGDLSSNSFLLRLRKDRKVKLTWKEPIQDDELNKRYKARQESELELSDLETMRHILHRLGYTAERVYEKYREHFVREDGAVAELDRLPHMGVFLEFEATPEAMEQAAAALGLDTSSGLRDSYFTLFTQWCSSRGVQYNDMRFEDEE